MPDTRKALWQIHFCVLLWGFTAILGKLITLPAFALVWWRMLLVTMALLLVPRVWRGLRAMPARLLLRFAGIGVVVALHWLTFYGAIKLSNASVAVSCLALGSVFGFFVSPLAAQLSRKHEFEADAYAGEHASAADLASALLKLHQDNAATLTPDPLYARFYYSHPPASERLAALGHLPGAAAQAQPG